MDQNAHIQIGTCGWSCEDWRGFFYPEHLPTTERLEFYARHFPAVEIDSTFYHTPTAEVAAHWAKITPPNFAFACKLVREITHERMLRDSTQPLCEFLAALSPLGNKLWSVLVQLPPFFTPAHDEVALRDFVRRLPGGVRFAIEFHHPDWHHSRVAHLLAEHHVAWVWNDLTPVEHQEEGAFELLPDPTDFLYLRLMGALEKKSAAGEQVDHHYRQLQWPRDPAIENWAVRVRQAAKDHPRIFVAVNNHYEGFAPETARRLGSRLGFDFPLPAAKNDPAADDGRQMKLL